MNQKGFASLIALAVAGIIALGLIGGAVIYKQNTDNQIAELQNQNLGGQAFEPSGYVGTLTKRLTQGGAETSLTTTPATTPDGQKLSAYEMGDFIVLTVNPGSANQEKISVTLTSAANTTATWGIINRGLSFASATSTITANKKAHAIGEKVIISNDNQFLAEQYMSIDKNQTLNSIKTFLSTLAPLYNINPTWTDQASTTLASKGYVDDTAFVGAPDASTIAKGVIELATKAETAAGTAMGGTGAYMCPANSSFSSSQSATTTIPVTGTNGKLSQGFLDLTQSFTFSGGVSSNNTTLSGTKTDSSVTSNTGTTNFANSIPTVYANATSSSQLATKGQLDTATTSLKFTTVTGNATASTTVAVASGQIVTSVCAMTLAGNNSSYVATLQSDVGGSGGSVTLQQSSGSTAGGDIISKFSGLSTGNHTFWVTTTGGSWSGTCLYQAYLSN